MQKLPDIHEIAQGRWPGILASLGVPLKHLDGNHHPCPLCGGTDRWRFDAKLYKGRGGCICNQCGPKTGPDMVMSLKGVEFAEACRIITEAAGHVQPEWKRASEATSFDPVKFNSDVWASAQPIERSDPAGLWLRRRGITLDTFPSQLRFLPRARFRHEDGKSATYHPAMLAQFVSPDTKQRTTHVTYLDASGSKAKLPKVRKYGPGPIPKGGAVRLSPSAETMGIAEGIETALAAAALNDVPVWAACDKQQLMTWEPPETVKCVIVFGDTDGNYAGQTAAYHLANRLTCGPRKLHVTVRLPDLADTDWNDVLLNEQEAA
jgi:putative DNA primase/helicase